MSEIKHTPGPLAWRIFDGEGGYDYIEDEPAEVNVNFAAKYGRKYEPLYAAPIELIEASKWAANYIDTIVDPHALKVLDALRAAIGKAEGKP